MQKPTTQQRERYELACRAVLIQELNSTEEGYYLLGMIAAIGTMAEAEDLDPREMTQSLVSRLNANRLVIFEAKHETTHQWCIIADASARWWRKRYTSRAAAERVMADIMRDWSRWTRAVIDVDLATRFVQGSGLTVSA